MKKDLCVFYYPDDITIFFSLYPFIVNSVFRKRVKFTTDLDYVLNRSKEESILLVRLIKRKDICYDTLFMEKVRDKYKTVYYFDDTAGVDELNTAVFPYVDKYFKKQIHKDLNFYKSPNYGDRIYSNYYHDNYGINDTIELYRDGLKDEWINKIELSWNLGIGCYPKLPNRNGIARRLHDVVGIKGLLPLFSNPLKYQNNKPALNKISARYSMNFNKESVAFHRAIYQDSINNNTLFLTGKVPLKVYNRELKNVKATFSPFGWGEVCFRDFEAIINRSLLIKPSMEHVHTWPQVYLKDETYKSVDWDSKNLLDVSEQVMKDQKEIDMLTENALEIFNQSYKNLNARVEQLIFNQEKL